MSDILERHGLPALQQCYEQQAVVVGVRAGRSVLDPGRVYTKGAAVDVAGIRHGRIYHGLGAAAFLMVGDALEGRATCRVRRHCTATPYAAVVGA